MGLDFSFESGILVVELIFDSCARGMKICIHLYPVMENRIPRIQNLIQQTPEDCFLWHALGLEFIKLNDLDNALNAFEKVLALDANYIGTYYHLAKLLELRKEVDRAIAVYEEGIQRAILLKDQHARNELQMALDDLMD